MTIRQTIKNKPLTLNISQGFIFGDPGQIRTADLHLRRVPLYPAELRNHVTTNYKSVSVIVKYSLQKNLMFKNFREIFASSVF